MWELIKIKARFLLRRKKQSETCRVKFPVGAGYELIAA